MFRQKNADSLDWNAFEETAKRFGLLGFAQSMNHLADFIIRGDEGILNKKDRMLLNDIFSDHISTSSQAFSLAGRWVLIKEALKAGWKYRMFSDVSMLKWLWQSGVGYFFDKKPKL